MVHAVHGSVIVKMCGVCAAVLALLAFAQNLLKKKKKNMVQMFRISLPLNDVKN